MVVRWKGGENHPGFGFTVEVRTMNSASGIWRAFDHLTWVINNGGEVGLVVGPLGCKNEFLTQLKFIQTSPTRTNGATTISQKKHLYNIIIKLYKVFIQINIPCDL